MKKILITGANGFLGSEIVNRLIKDNYSLTLVTRRGSYLGRLNLQDVYKNIRYICDENDIENIVYQAQPEIVINTVCNYGRRSEIDKTIREANVEFPKRLFTAAEKSAKLF